MEQTCPDHVGPVMPTMVRQPGSQASLDAVDYYRKSRSEMLEFLPANPQRLIDVGCGQGLFGEAVKKRFPACEIWGIEPVAAAAEDAARRADYVLHAPLESVPDLPSAYFDAVTMNDVLEHMTWPEPALALARRILKPEGRLILSLPNIAYYGIVHDLIFKNDWEYADFGILDRTHFRFYTAKSARRLLERNRFQVERIVGINRMRPRWYYRIVFAMAPKYFYWMSYFQFAVVARPLPE